MIGGHGVHKVDPFDLEILLLMDASGVGVLIFVDIEDYGWAGWSDEGFEFGDVAEIGDEDEVVGVEVMDVLGEFGGAVLHAGAPALGGEGVEGDVVA